MKKFSFSVRKVLNDKNPCNFWKCQQENMWNNYEAIDEVWTSVI